MALVIKAARRHVVVLNSLWWNICEWKRRIKVINLHPEGSGPDYSGTKHLL